jgi:hypothetical protein
MKTNMKKSLAVVVGLSLLGCSHNIPINSTPVKTLSFKEKAEVLSTTYSDKDLTLVELETPLNTAGQNGELQIWLESNKPTPFAGVLLNPEGMAYILSSFESQKDLSNLAIKKQRDLDLNKLNLETGKLFIQIETIEKKNDVILKGRDEELVRLQQINDKLIKDIRSPWKKILIGVSGVIIGVGAGILIKTVAPN